MFPILALMSDWALLVLRLVLGLILVVHGWPKIKNLRGTGAWMASVGFRPGIFWAVVAAAVEFFGGLALVAGFGVQVVAFFVAGQFIVISAWKIIKRQPLVGGFELDLIILASALALLVLGGGAYAL